MSNAQIQIRQLLNNPRIGTDQKLSFIKQNAGGGEYAAIFDRYQVLKSGLLKGSSFTRAEEIKQRNAFDFTNDFKKELSWISYNILKHASTINSFLKEKHHFEELFLLEKYDDAYALLEKIKSDFGENLWTIEMTLLIKEYKYGTKENWSVLSDYLPKLNSPFYQFLINFFSKKIEKEMSFENCFKQFGNDLEDVLAEDEVTDYLVFKSIFFADYPYSSLEGVIYVGNVFSTIDQYLLTIDVLVKEVSQNFSHDKQTLNFIKQLFDNGVQDSRIIQLANFLDKEGKFIWIDSTADILELIENYTKGKYKESLDDSIKLIQGFPSCFEIYNIYIKSLMHLKLTPKKVGNSFIDEILDNMWKASLCDLNSDIYRDQLLKKSLVLISFDFGKQLYAYASELKGLKTQNNDLIIGCLCSQTNNPRILSLKIGDRFEYLSKNFFSNELLVSSHVNTYLAGHDCSLDGFNISDQNKLVYSARHFFSRKEYISAIQAASGLQIENIPPFYREQVLLILYNSYVESDQLREALQLGGNILIDDFYVNRIHFGDLYTKIQAKGFENFSDLIDLPIVMGDTVQGYDLYIVYDEFMAYVQEDFPSRLDITELKLKYSQPRLVFFLKEICTVPTLQNSLVFESIEMVEQERCEICEILKVLDNANIKLYEKEISDILKSASVRKAIKEVDEGRLFVNIESLKSLHSKGLKESFNRFKEIERVTKDINLIAFNSSKDRNWQAYNPTDAESTTSPNEEFNKYNNPAFIAFKSIYQETREKFLFSKEYGLDSCLSTRVRHGALKNHIRSVFEKLSLVTSKTGEVYLDNKKWHEQLSGDEELNSQVQSALRNFSKEIDDFTTYIVDSLIQIQTEKQVTKRDGLFNYGTSDRTLWEFMNEHRNRFTTEADIVDILYTDLTNYTTRVIGASIISKITGEVNNKFQGFIEKLQVEIRALNIPGNSDLPTNISKSSTDIQNELEYIAEWFIFRTSESSSLLDIETIIDASKELTNKINPNNQLNPEIKIDCEPFVGYTHLIFVFNILMTNIIKHSGLSPDKLTTKIHVSNIGEYIKITFSNNFSTKMNKPESERRLQNIKENWNNHEKIERSNIEGESGFDKIKRILLYEALAKSDKFEFEIIEDIISISLFLPFKEYTINEDTDN